MNTRPWLSRGLLGFVLLLPAMGCATDDPGSAETASELTLGGPIYDGTTSCTVSGITMHCCPSGMVMVGAHIGKDVFKCAPLASLVGAPFVDSSTVRNNMHACPQGALMVGLHVNLNKLLCQFPNPHTSLQDEFVDFRTLDSFVMHVCANTAFGASAMAGIHVLADRFTCDS